MRRVVNVFAPPLLILALAPQATPGPRAGESRDRPPRSQAEKAPAGSAASAAVLPGLRIEAQRAAPGGQQSVVIFGSGIGIWQRRTQFSVSEQALGQLRGLLEAAKVEKMAATYGGGKQRIRRYLSLREGGRIWRVGQLMDGEQSEALGKLVDQIFDLAEPLSHSGITVQSLTEGLHKLASGALAPESFELIAQSMPPRGAAGDLESWVLRVEEGVGTTQPYVEGRNRERIPLRFDRTQLRELASAIEASGFESLPVNLYAGHYEEVLVEVLGWRKRVIANRFARMDPTTNGEQQVRFERLFDHLRGLAQGSPAVEGPLSR